MKYKGIKKLYYSISEISELLGVKQSVIRYWESEFKELKPQKNRAGNRIYKKDDIAILRLIHHYVYERHLSIHEANEVITDLKKDGLYKRKLQEVNSVDFKPVKKVEEVEEVDKVEDKPQFEIVTPSEETFIYPLDEEEGSQDEDSRQKAEAGKHTPEESSQIIKEESQGIPEPEITPKPKPIEETKPEPVVQTEPVKQSDPELKELLKKISGNIKDIIDILNE